MITTATNSTAIFTFTSNSQLGFRFSNLALTNTAGTRANGYTTNGGAPQGILIDNHYISGMNIGIMGDAAAVSIINSLIVNNTEIASSVSHGISVSGQTYISNSYIHDNGGTGWDMGNSSGENQGYTAVNSVFYKNNVGINQRHSSSLAPVLVVNCDVTDSTSDGIASTGGGSSNYWRLINNILYKNGGFGVDFTSVTGSFPSDNSTINYNNAYGSNTSGARANLSAGIGDVTLSVDPFVARTAGNFALNNTAGGGASLRGFGLPGTIPDAGSGSISMGALQPSAGGTASSAAYTQ